MALLSEKIQALDVQEGVLSEKPMLEDHLAKGKPSTFSLYYQLISLDLVSYRVLESEDEGAAPSDVVMESDLVTEFLRTLSNDKPNAVLLGVALLLQMSAHVKPWCVSYADNVSLLKNSLY